MATMPRCMCKQSAAGLQPHRLQLTESIWHAYAGGCSGAQERTLMSTSVVYMLVPMPSWRATSLPMSSWSPVTILTLMPFSMHFSMVSLVSCLQQAGGCQQGAVQAAQWTLLKRNNAAQTAEMQAAQAFFKGSSKPACWH